MTDNCGTSCTIFLKFFISIWSLMMVCSPTLSRDAVIGYNNNIIYPDIGKHLRFSVDLNLIHPLLASACLFQSTVFNRLQQAIKKNETLIRYFIHFQNSYVLLVSKRWIKTIPIGAEKKEIDSMVNAYLLAIKEDNAAHIKRYGRLLYLELLQPLKDFITGSKNIIIVPDGMLSQIPFEALTFPNKSHCGPEFFLETHGVKYIQAESILLSLRNRRSSHHSIKSFAGFGDPVYDYENYSNGHPETVSLHRNDNTPVSDRTGDKLNRLPASGQEVLTIDKMFKKRSFKSMVFPRNLATEDNAKAENLKQFDSIHFACHGFFDGCFQSLVLSQDVPGSKEDGYFTLEEIRNCNYNASLVVFSACRTGWGKIESGQGITYLTQAVMSAGTPCVVASLWDVDDNATRDLMIYFYRNLLEKNMDKTEAFKHAKLELMKDERYRSPLYWSAFVMYGE